MLDISFMTITNYTHCLTYYGKVSKKVIWEMAIYLRFLKPKAGKTECHQSFPIEIFCCGEIRSFIFKIRNFKELVQL